MKFIKNKKQKFSRERHAKQQTSQAVFRRSASLDMQHLHKIAAEQTTQRHENNRLKVHKFKIYFSIVAVLILLILYFFATKINSVKIQTINDRIDQATSRRYQNSVIKSFNSNMLGNFKFFVSSNKIATDLQKDNPEISKVSLKSNPFSNNITAVIEFKKPALIWQTKNGQRFYVSDSGQTFKVNYSHTSDDSLIKLFDTSGLSTSQGKIVVSNDEIAFVTSVNKLLKQKGITVSQYSIPASSKEINVVLKDKPYTIKLLISNDAGQEVAQIKQSISFFKKHPEQTPKKYLDLRIIGKAFYQ